MENFESSYSLENSMDSYGSEEASTDSDEADWEDNFGWEEQEETPATQEDLSDYSEEMPEPSYPRDPN